MGPLSLVQSFNSTSPAAPYSCKLHSGTMRPFAPQALCIQVNKSQRAPEPRNWLSSLNLSSHWSPNAITTFTPTLRGAVHAEMNRILANPKFKDKLQKTRFADADKPPSPLPPLENGRRNSVALHTAALQKKPTVQNTNKNTLFVDARICIDYPNDGGGIRVFQKHFELLP